MASSSDSKPNFLDLPPELRNIVYDFALVPDEPIELAPICFGTFDFEERHEHKALAPHGYYGPRPDQPGPHGYFLGGSWHLHRYNTKIRPSLMLLRVCKEVNEESASVFYGQQFRFTSTYGWYILHDWLKLIGSSNRAHVRHISVAHPGVSRLFERHERNAVYERYTDIAGINLALSPVPDNHPLTVRRISLEPDEEEEQQAKLDEWMFKTRRKDTLGEILKLNELRSLRLVLFNSEWRQDYLYLTDFVGHPIHKADFSGLAKVQLSIVNLRSCHEGLNNELKLIDNFYNTSKSLEAAYETSHIRAEAKEFFTTVTEQGWKIEEAVYDNHFTWPAPETEKCNNSAICRFLRDSLSIFVGKSMKANQEVYPKDGLEAWKEKIIDGCCGMVKKGK